MVRQMFAALTLLLITGCCKAQNTGCNNIKNKERTTERFDSTRYYTHKQRTEYVFEDSIKGRVRQFGGENGSLSMQGKIMNYSVPIRNITTRQRRSRK